MFKTPLPEKLIIQPETMSGGIEVLRQTVNQLIDYLKEREEAPRVERCGLGIMKREEVEEKPKLKEELMKAFRNLEQYKVSNGVEVTHWQKHELMLKRDDVEAIINRLMP